jgi:hypothetical protein
MAFILHWRYWADTNHNLTQNFLTRETCLDLITSCHGCIFRFVMFRECWEGKFKPDGPRFSSAYSECAQAIEFEPAPNNPHSNLS